MSARFEELGWQRTPMGEISLRRRFDPSLRLDVYEVKLGDEYLMSSLFTVAEEELANPRAWPPRPDTVSRCSSAGSDWGSSPRSPRCEMTASLSILAVVDALPAVIGWHERELLPGWPPCLAADPSLVSAGGTATSSPRSTGDGGFGARQPRPAPYRRGAA